MALGDFRLWATVDGAVDLLCNRCRGGRPVAELIHDSLAGVVGSARRHDVEVHGEDWTVTG